MQQWHWCAPLSSVRSTTVTLWWLEHRRHSCVACSRFLMPRLDWSALPASTRSWRGCCASYTGWRCRNESISRCAESVRRTSAATLDDTRDLMTPSRVWYRRRDAPLSETGLSLWRPPEPEMHCVRSEPSLSIFRRQLKTYLFHASFQEKSTKPITVILIWRFMHCYRILYCFFNIFVQCSCSNCDGATLKYIFVIIIIIIIIIIWNNFVDHNFVGCRWHNILTLTTYQITSHGVSRKKPDLLLVLALELCHNYVISCVQVMTIFTYWHPANVNVFVLTWPTLRTTLATPYTTTLRWDQLRQNTTSLPLDSTAETQVSQ